MTSRHQTDIEQRRLAQHVRTALDASADQIRPDIAERLAAGRRIALARRKVTATVRAPQLAAAGGRGTLGDESFGLHRVGDWLRRLGLLWAVAALAAGLAGIYDWQQQQRVDELVDLDAAMLLDDLPPSAYADQGFHMFLKDDE
ncbi:DUF3619 domain-containing protein [Cupriavidus respiraculi]|uniref:DUF3619 family protein n=1 Tax=Cupriavidus respiraculi TaxID=195930 RepID=A0ABN7YMD9_9BURK|nr:DUF3619 family protein [Cupriavidus respiraculi]MBY4945640.1 DUF3619 family protein [Cupriavidus respiraculi]CAG9173581.1 hypothetical protein LMG21510_02304 [Cupriavidus respiraculi]